MDLRHDVEVVPFHFLQDYSICCLDTTPAASFQFSSTWVTMKVMKIGIFGAHGELGKILCNRLGVVKPASVELLPTIDRHLNKEIASTCDLAIIVVRPAQVEELLKEIAPHLKPSARVLSFAAFYPLRLLCENSGRACARAMMDPWSSVSAFFQAADFDTRGLEFIFSGLTKRPSLTLHSDADLDAFAVHMCQLFVTLFLSEGGEVGAAPHLKYLAAPLHASVEELQTLLLSGDPHELLTTLSTKGGISEMITTLICSNPKISPGEIFAKVSKSFSGRF
jgi:hypothetical protein